jgi:hypothetical protein
VSGVDAALVEVLAGHREVAEDPAMHGWGCSCGWGGGPWRATEHAWLTHLAEQVAAYVERQVAVALEGAAVAVEAERVDLSDEWSPWPTDETARNFGLNEAARIVREAKP